MLSSMIYHIKWFSLRFTDITLLSLKVFKIWQEAIILHFVHHFLLETAFNHLTLLFADTHYLRKLAIISTITCISDYSKRTGLFEAVFYRVKYY